MGALLWALAHLAVAFVLAAVFLSCIASVVLTVGLIREHHRAGMQRLRDEREREAWQRFCDANRDIDVDAP